MGDPVHLQRFADDVPGRHAAAAFADQPQGFPLIDRKADSVDRIDVSSGAAKQTFLYRKMLLKPGDLDHRGTVSSSPLRRSNLWCQSTSHPARRAFPNASRPPNAPAAIAHRVEIAP